MSKLQSLCVCLLTTIAAASGAEQTQYKYDALGRLIHSETRAAGGHGHQVSSQFDAASNRSSIQDSGNFKPTWLESGQSLMLGEAILSDNALYKLVFEHDGNLVLYGENNNVIWSAATQGLAADHATMQGDGNFVIYAGTRPVWFTGAGVSGSRLAVQTDGNIVIYSPANSPVWARYGCC